MSETLKVKFVKQEDEQTIWYVRDNIVIDVEPKRLHMWINTKIVTPIGPGKRLLVQMNDGFNSLLNDPVESVETLTDAEAEVADMYYQEWITYLNNKKTA